jgi:predicted fused transcriptional regulator/phosphomethylpyrimidine kinase
MFHEDGTFNFHNEIMILAEEFCQEWVQRQGQFKNRIEAALILNFALCTIKHDTEQLIQELEWQPIFKGISPRDIYERGGFGEEPSQGLSDHDVAELVKKALRRLRLH